MRSGLTGHTGQAAQERVVMGSCNEKDLASLSQHVHAKVNFVFFFLNFRPFDTVCS